MAALAPTEAAAGGATAALLNPTPTPTGINNVLNIVVSTPQSLNYLQTGLRFLLFGYLLGALPVYFIELAHNDYDFMKTTFTSWSSIRVWLFWPLTLIVRPIIASMLENTKSIEECSSVKKWTLNAAMPGAGTEYCAAVKNIKKAQQIVKNTDKKQFTQNANMRVITECGARVSKEPLAPEGVMQQAPPTAKSPRQ